MGRKLIPNIQKGSKRIKTPELAPASTNKFKPIFSFEYLDDDYCISKCEKHEKASFADTLRVMGKMTWEELINTRRHANGCEEIPVKQIRGHLPKIITEDVDHVLAFRFQGKKPMVGHRVKETFYVIWLDRNFKLYPH